MKASSSCLCAAICASLAAWSFADSTTIGPFKDSTLYEDPNGSLANGAGPGMFAGRTGQASNSIRRGLVAFLPVEFVPFGATIDAVELRLYVSQTNAGNETITLHRPLAVWGEGHSIAGNMGGGSGAPAEEFDATWTQRVNGHFAWNTLGGDFDPTPIASQSVGGVGFYYWGSTPQMVADVQSWLDNNNENRGWLIKGNESASSTSKRFSTREDDTNDYEFIPLLTIHYTPLKYCSSEAPWNPCDTNCNGTVNAFDIQPFIQLLTPPAPPPCSSCAGDANNNGTVNAFDINAFLDCLIP